MKNRIPTFGKPANDQEALSLAAARAMRNAPNDEVSYAHANDDFPFANNDNPAWDAAFREVLHRYESFKREYEDGGLRNASNLTVRLLELGANITSIRSMLPKNPKPESQARTVLDVLNRIEADIQACRP
jgi:hypothetical protein